MRFIASVLPITLSLMFSPEARAYLPPSQFLVKTIANKRVAPKGVRAKTVVTSIEADQPTSTHFKVTTVAHADRGVLRSFVFDDAGQQLYAHERKMGASTGDLTLGEISTEVLFDSNTERLISVLRAAGIPVLREADAQAEQSPAETMFLARWKKTVAWVIGPRKDFKAQLWIEKDTFLPIRLVWDGSNPRELQFEGFRFTSEFPFPRAIAFVQDGNLRFREELTEVSVNPVADIKAFAQPITPGFTEAGNNAPDAVKELIRRYFEVLR